MRLMEELMNIEAVPLNGSSHSPLPCFISLLLMSSASTFLSVKTTASSPLFGSCLFYRVLHLLIVPSPLYTAASAPVPSLLLHSSGPAAALGHCRTGTLS